LDASDVLRIEGSRHKVYAAPLPPGLRDLSDEEIKEAWRLARDEIGKQFPHITMPERKRIITQAIIKAAREAA